MKRFCCITFLILFSFALFSQQPAPYFSAVIVEQIDSSVKWYSSVLNLKELKRQENKEAGYKIVNLGNEAFLLELLELETGVSPKTLLENQPGKKWVKGIMKMGFKIHDIESAYREYKNRGISMRGDMIADPVTGKKSFIILDPDGNYIQFFEH